MLGSVSKAGSTSVVAAGNKRVNLVFLKKTSAPIQHHPNYHTYITRFKSKEDILESCNTGFPLGKQSIPECHIPAISIMSGCGQQRRASTLRSEK